MSKGYVFIKNNEIDILSVSNTETNVKLLVIVMYLHKPNVNRQTPLYIVNELYSLVVQKTGGHIKPCTITIDKAN